jgi:hypothetical protein
MCVLRHNTYVSGDILTSILDALHFIPSAHRKLTL